MSISVPQGSFSNFSTPAAGASTAEILATSTANMQAAVHNNALMSSAQQEAGNANGAVKGAANVS